MECAHGVRRRQLKIDFAHVKIIESLTNEQIDHLRRREREAAETQVAILRALVRQLLSNCGSELSEDEAAREVGVSSRKVLSHFPSRERMSEGAAMGAADHRRSAFTIDARGPAAHRFAPGTDRLSGHSLCVAVSV